MTGYICKFKCQFEEKGSRKTFRSGKKWCKICERGMPFEDLYCYCCGCKLRINASRRTRTWRVTPVKRI